MLRVTGVLALATSALATVLLFGRVKTVRVTGELRSGRSSAPIVIGFPGANAPEFSDEATPALGAGYGFGTSGNIYLWFRDTEEIEHDLPESGFETATLTHRWVTFGRLRAPYGCTEIRAMDRMYVVGRSQAAFFGMLTLISAGPSLLWLLAALPALFQRRSKPPGSVA